MISDYGTLKVPTPIKIPYYFSEELENDTHISETLYKLVQEIRQTYRAFKEKKPITCHCASGVGRMEAFIASFILAEMLDIYT